MPVNCGLYLILSLSLGVLDQLPVRCSNADDQLGSREATVVFETGLPSNVTRRGATVRFLCEERTPSWKMMGPLEDSHHREATD